MAAINNSQQNLPLSSSGSDSEPSPAFTSPEYYNMMQQYNAESSSMGDNFSGAATSSLEDSTPALSSAQDQFDNFNFAQASNDLFDTPQDLNRRTLTQEQFNTMQQTGLQLSETGDFNLDMDSDVFSRMFPDYSQQDTKSQLAYDFSDLPPGSAEQSSMGFPSSGAMQSRSVTSSASSDWGGSRSSSISTYSHDGHVAQPVAASHPQAAHTSSTWRPGQSVPVDFNQLSQEFRQIAQSRPLHQDYSQEQPLAFPDDEAFGERRGSHTAGITQSMGNVGIKTPQPQQHAAFKSPIPSTSLATRRQRTKPTPLGLASMRSQSYSAASQPGSPAPIAPQQQQQHAIVGSPMPIRRIKSSNMMNAVAQGRIQKASIGSAQRSPLKFTFAEAMSSPKGTRHMSHSGSNLVPPMPMSPREQSNADSARQFQQWQSSSGQASRQASISENDFEQHTTYGPSVSGPPDNVSSPPHTPLYPPQPQFSQQRVGKNIITENTPPQSAPATQQSFHNGSFIHPQSHAIQHQPVAVSQAQVSQQAMQHMFTANPPLMMAPEPQFSMGDMGMPQHPQFTLTNSDPMAAPDMHFPMGGVPMVDANGNFQMTMPQPHYQLVSHAPLMNSVPAPPLSHTPPVHYPFPSTSPGLQISAHAPKVAAQPELFVHEYQPPADVKRAATPRKVTAESGPKNYTFANQTPEHFEKGKKSSSNGSDHSPESNSS
jgi:hypothetical protein